MNFISFSPTIDLTLTLVVLTGFILNFVHWSKSKSKNGANSLQPKLGMAIVRVVFLFAIILFLCWFADIAVWSILAFFAMVGIIVAVCSGDNLGLELSIALTAGLVREWCFGFPQLILEPPVTDRVHQNQKDDLIGAVCTVASPLKPSGDVMINEEICAAVSENGTFIDLETTVVVTAFRNGRLYVRETV